MTLRTLAVLCVLSGCATTNSRPATQRLEVASLCDRITAQACSPSGRAAAPEDLATLVLGTVSEGDAAFASILDGLVKVEPANRKASLIKAVSDAGGSPWTCASLDQMWANQAVACAP